MPTSTLRTGPFPIKGVSGRFKLLVSLKEIHVFNANSVDPDQPRSKASDLVLHCLPMSLIWDTVHYKWVKMGCGTKIHRNAKIV